MISKWFVFSTLTQLYSSSPESYIALDLSYFRNNNDLISVLTNIRGTELPDDFWSVTLPERLKSSRENHVSHVYNASQIYKSNDILFSDYKIKDFLSPLIKSPKKQVEKHHIFPKNYLIKTFHLEEKDYNQVANYIYIDSYVNKFICDLPPVKYWPLVLSKCKKVKRKNIEETYNKNYDLPLEFWKMDYDDFLIERRKLMAASIREYFEKL